MTLNSNLFTLKANEKVLQGESEKENIFKMEKFKH